METLEAIAKRTSTRKFKEIQISEENLQAILKAGMSAPVGSGLYESLHITVIQDMNILNIIGDAVTEMIYKKFGKRMVIENMAIATTSLGIDNVVWAGPTTVISKNTEISNAIHIPDNFNPILCISFGYGVEVNEPKNHKIMTNRI